MNERNILALYPGRDEAEQVKASLQAAGIHETDIEIYSGSAESLLDDVRAFSDEGDRVASFAQAVVDGGALLTAKVGDESAPAAFKVLQGTAPLDVDAVEGAFRRPRALRG